MHERTSDQSHNEVVDLDEAEPARRVALTADHPLARLCSQSIGQYEILSLANGDAGTAIYVSEFHRIGLEAHLKLFAAPIAGRLIELLRVSDSLGSSTNHRLVAGLLAEADRLKNSAAKQDAMPWRSCTWPQKDQRISPNQNGHGKIPTEVLRQRLLSRHWPDFFKPLEVTPNFENEQTRNNRSHR